MHNRKEKKQYILLKLYTACDNPSVLAPTIRHVSWATWEGKALSVRFESLTDQKGGVKERMGWVFEEWVIAANGVLGFGIDNESRCKNADRVSPSSADFFLARFQA